MINTTKIDSRIYGNLILMLKSTLDSGRISIKTANLTTERIAKQNELNPIYLW